MTNFSASERSTFATQRFAFRVPLVALCLLTFTSIASPNTFTVYGDPADATVTPSQIYPGDPGNNDGQVGVNGGYVVSDVYVFRLPTLAAGMRIGAADFSFYADGYSSNYTVDLYGLLYRTSSTVLTSDAYSGPNDTQNTLIQSTILPRFGPVGRIATTSAADTSLAAYLNAQYAAGAVGGDYVFLRLSNSVANGDNPNVDFVYNADLAYYLNTIYPGLLTYFEGLYSPKLDITTTVGSVSAVPEPSYLIVLAWGLLAGAFVNWRRSKERDRRQFTDKSDSSEVELESHLHLAGGIGLRGDFSESRRSHGQVRRRKLRVIERVKRFGAKLHERAFAKLG
jgi:hypothetical protein